MPTASSCASPPAISIAWLSRSNRSCPTMRSVMSISASSSTCSRFCAIIDQESLRGWCSNTGSLGRFPTTSRTPRRRRKILLRWRLLRAEPWNQADLAAAPGRCRRQLESSQVISQRGRQRLCPDPRVLAEKANGDDRIASKGGLRLWLNGELTLIERACDDLADDVELREGWNTILILRRRGRRPVRHSLAISRRRTARWSARRRIESVCVVVQASHLQSGRRVACTTNACIIESTAFLHTCLNAGRNAHSVGNEPRDE